MRGDPVVSATLTSHARADVFLPAPAIAEIEYGLARLPRSARRQKLRETFDGILAEIRRDEWTDDVSRTFGEIKANLEQRGVRLEDFDVAVAAHALARGAILVADHTSDMNRIRDLRVENWRLGRPQ